jgi:hypothetical protein
MSKTTKSAAKYGEGMKEAHCGICEHFTPPHDCALVEGKISPQAWCKFFQKKKKKWSGLTKTYF